MGEKKKGGETRKLGSDNMEDLKCSKKRRGFPRREDAPVVLYQGLGEVRGGGVKGPHFKLEHTGGGTFRSCHRSEEL